MFTNKNLPCIIDLDFKNFPSEVIFHQGRTDKNGGHTDLFNKSGLGVYHFHHRLSAHLHNKTNPICPYENTQTFIINPHNGKKVPIGQPYIVENIKYYSINLVSKALVFLDYMGGVKSSSDGTDGEFYICSTFDSSIISSYEEFTFIYPKVLLMIKNNTFFKTQNDKLQLISNSTTTDPLNCYAYVTLNEIKNHMLKNGYFTDFCDDGNDVWSFKRKNNVIIKSPKNGDLFKVGDVLKVEIYTNNVMYATLNIGNYKELKNSIENKNIVTFSDYIFTSDNIGVIDIEVKVGDSIYLDTASSTVQVSVEASGDVFKYNWTSLKVQGLETEHVTEDFKKKVIEVCYKLGVNPDDLMSIMAFESGLNPAYKNPDSSASGLIGFMKPTAVDLDTTTDELRKMSAVEQLEYVYKYFKGWNVKTLGDMYMRVLWPRGIGENDDYILWEKDDQNTSKYYNANSYLDINQDGIVTKKEAYQRIIEQRDSVYK